MNLLLCFSHKMIVIFFNLMLLLADNVHPQTRTSNDTVTRALQNWKSTLDNESRKLLSSWVGPDPCRSWVGIGCSNNNSSVTRISLENLHLQGNLNYFNFVNLSSLHSLNLYNSRLSGFIPSEIRYLRHLRYLNLSRNQLTGRIPFELGELSSLENLDLASNNLDGQIPVSLGNLTRLNYLYLHENGLSGPIPLDLGGPKNLIDLRLSTNQLVGPILSSFENFTRIEYLHLHTNRLTGAIPPKLGSPKTLIDLRLYDNHLTGSIPGSLGNYTRLVSLYLHQNQLSGSIPIVLGNMKTLLDLALSVNNLTGSFPEELNNLTTRLEILSLGSNKLSGRLPTRVCHGGSLQIFSVNNNAFSGPVPSTIKNCSKLIRLRFDGNQITGNISDAFGVYDDLEYIDLSRNNLYGEISTDWALCGSLTSLKISKNNLSGVIPNNLGDSRLQEVDLSSNHLIGEIPRSFGRLSSLITLLLDDNRLSGNIPPEFGELSNLGSLSLAKNDLMGAIPREIGECSRLQILNLSGNYLQNVFPIEFTSLVELQVLDLSHNGLTGGLPKQFGGLKMLEILNISHNNLTGSIPMTFVDLWSLITIDISYNQLEGCVPDIQIFRQAPLEALENNKGLCGNITGLQDCPRKLINQKRTNIQTLKIVILVPTICLVFILLVIVVLIFWQKTSKKKKETNEPENPYPFAVWNYDGKMMYETIIEAVDDFNPKNIIGTGGCGTVYQGELPTGQLVAVKKFDMQEPDRLLDAKSFENEIRALTETRHHNIVRMYGFCSHPRHMFLVYELIDGGSLRNILNNVEMAKEFDWYKRANVIKGIADALSYMHHDCSEPIVHRDLSSSNILLDSEFVAHLSDFGTAKFLNSGSSNWTSFAGTYGYSAPELAYSWEVNEKCDVFSFGVVTLEVMMGTHAGDLVSLMFRLNVKEIAMMVVLDQRLLPPKGHVEEVVNFIVELALMCLNTNPSSRPSMRQVSIELSRIIPL